MSLTEEQFQRQVIQFYKEENKTLREIIEQQTVIIQLLESEDGKDIVWH